MSEGDQVEQELEETQPEIDHRLYVPYSSGWSAHIKNTGGTERCFAQHPGQDFFHLIVKGEIFLQKSDERFCLTCAIRRKIIGYDRMFWQRQSEVPVIEPLDEPFDDLI